MATSTVRGSRGSLDDDGAAPATPGGEERTSADGKKAPKGKSGSKSRKKADKKPRSKKRLLLLIALLVLVGGGAGGYVMFQGKSAPATDGAPKPKPTPVPGITLALDPITVNLAGGRYLRIGIAIQFSTKATAKDGTQPDGARALDQAILYLSDKQAEDLQTPEQIDAAKQELTSRLSAAYDDNVMEVLLTQFVIQ